MVTSFYLGPEGALKQGLSDDEMRAAVRSGAGLLWVDLAKPTPDETFILDEVFGFHPLAIEDCQQVSRCPKLDEYRTYLFIVFLAPNPNFGRKEAQAGSANGDEPVSEVDIFLGPNFVVTYRLAALPFLQNLMDRVKREPKRALGRGASFLVHNILDSAVDQFFAMVERLQEEAEEAEEGMAERSTKKLLPRVLELKRRVLNLRRQMSDHREMIQRLVRGAHSVMAAEALPYYRDILDHLNLIERDLDVCRETLDNARDVFLALANTRTNEVIRVLTVLFTLTLPFTVLTSWYGMNFKHLPAFEHEYAPWAFTGLMLVVSGFLYWWLRAKKWF